MSAPASVLKGAKVGGFTLLYLTAFVVFAYIGFPYARLKEYVVNQYNASQTGAADRHLEIDSLSWSWRFPGLVASGVRLVLPAAGDHSGGGQAGSGPSGSGQVRGARSNSDGADSSASDEAASGPLPRNLEAENVYITTSIFGLMVGSRAASFGASALGGELEGFVDESRKVRTLELSLEQINIGLIPQVSSAIGLPLMGRVSGTVELAMPPGKVNLAQGKINLQMDDLILGDGKAKIKNLIALPALKVGSFKLDAEIAKGRFKIKDCGASGGDLDLALTGGIRLRSRMMSSVADLSLKFQFSDRYKSKDEKTKLIFGDGKMKGLFESSTKEFLAKQDDGSFGMRLGGPFNRIHPRPLVDRKKRSKKARSRKLRRKAKKPAAKDSE